MRNNTNFKRLCTALNLTKHDVFEILGGETSKSQIDSWRRNPDSTKNATGTSTGNYVRRFREMPDEQFDKFCAALVEYLRNE